jgi:hypothetical protein
MPMGIGVTSLLIKLNIKYLFLNVLFSDWVSFLAYPNLFGIKGFVVVVVVFIFECFE